MRKTNNRNNPAIYLCDFGMGVLRIDIDRISLTENIDYKTGEYRGFGIACDFDFKLLEFIRKVKTLAKKKECFGNQGASMAESFPYDCSKCVDFKECRKKTFKVIAKEERNLSYYEFNRRG